MSMFSRPGNALQTVLRLNAGASLLVGIAMAVAPGPLADLCLADPGPYLGLDAGIWVRLVGLALLPFAGFCFWVSGRPAGWPALVRTICVLDWTWVVASVALLALGWNAFTWAGAVLVGLMALAVAAFAGLQARYLGSTLSAAAG